MNWREILKKPSANHQENRENQEYQNGQKLNNPDIADILGWDESKNKIKQAAEYLFFERLGISDSEELALDEALNHLITQLTIH
jgi:hypothetical protein